MKSRRVIALLAAGILSMSLASCGGSPASSASSAPAEQSVEQAAESDPAEQADEQTAESAPVEQAVEQTTSNAPAEEAVEQTAESVEDTAEQIPEEEAIPEGSEINESELEDGTKSTEIIKPDGSIRLVLEAPDGSRTETDYDPELYPQSKVVYDENGRKTSESTFRYDEDQLDTSWESATSYDENGNVEFTSETEILYPEDEGFMYGSDIEPKKTVTVVNDAQGEYVKTITYKNNREQETTIEFADGSKEVHYIIDGDFYGEAIKVPVSEYYHPNEDKLYLRIFEFPDGIRRVSEFLPDGTNEVHQYDADGNEMDY